MFPRKLSRKISAFVDSVIRTTTIKCQKQGAVNLSQGFPDFDAPSAVTSAGMDAIQQGYNQYSDPRGMEDFRSAISKKASQKLGIEIDPDTVVVTCGASEAMLVSLLALLDPEDEVILFEPYYENYYAQIQIASAHPRFVSLKPPDFRFDEQELEAAFTPRTKAIIVNTPNNPTGRIFSMRELEIIGRLCVENDVVAISDEIYQHLVYDKNEHISIATVDGMREKTIIINSLSKTFSVTGWRVGYAIAPEAIVSGIQKVHNFTTAAAPSPFQHAGINLLGLGDKYYDELRAIYEQKRLLLFKSLRQAGFHCRLPEGSYYIMAEISAFGFESDIEFNDYLIREIGVAAVPGTAFFQNKELGRKWLRFTFSKDFATLEEAARRLKRLKA